VLGPLNPAVAGLRTVGNEDAGKYQPNPAFVRNGPNEFSVHGQVKQPAMLVVSETWYPGWHARVNGREEHVWQVDGGLMGVYLRPGFANIQFYFRPDYFYVQLFATCIAVVCLGLAMALYLRSRRSSRPGEPTSREGVLRPLEQMR